MYSKVVIFLCVASLASAGHILEASAPVTYNTPVAYSSAPAVSSVSFTMRTAQAPVATYASAPNVEKSDDVPTYATYAGTPSYTEYAAASDAAKFYVSSVPYQSVSTQSVPVEHDKTYAAPAFTTYATAPAVAYSAPVYTKSSAPVGSYSSYYTHSAPSTYAAAAPVVTKTYAAPAYTTYATGPVVSKSYISPAVTTYSDTPLLNSGVTYSAAAVADITHAGLGANHSW